MDENKKPELCNHSVYLYGIPICILADIPCERVGKCPIFSSNIEVTIKELLNLAQGDKKDGWKKRRKVAE